MNEELEYKNMSWREKRIAKIKKLKEGKDRSIAPTMEELAEKPGYKDIKMRKLVIKSDNLAKEAAKDDYI
jgi:hypothetical protein